MKLSVVAGGLGILAASIVTLINWFVANCGQ